MKELRLRNALSTKVGIALAIALSIAAVSVEARAVDVRINVNIGGPPPIILHAPPRLVYLPEPAVYVAVGVPYDVYFVGGRYYNYYGNRWYYAPRYGGPWAIAGPTILPPVFRRYDVARFNVYRDREYDRLYRGSGRVGYYEADYGHPGKGKAKGHGRKGGKH